MIVVQCDLISAHNASRDRTLCRLEIFNESGAGSRRDYGVRLYSATRRGHKGRLIKTARVLGWPSEQLPAWRLIQEAFRALGEPNG